MRALARSFRGAASAGLACALALILAGPAAAAPAWRGAGGSAGAYDGPQALVELSCRGGALRLSAFSPGTRGGGASLVVSVDGTAFLFEARGEAPGRLAAEVPGAKAGLLVSALRKGKAAEVRVPAGRFALPLKGSGAALAPLAGTCAAAPG